MWSSCFCNGKCSVFPDLYYIWWCLWLILVRSTYLMLCALKRASLIGLLLYFLLQLCGFMHMSSLLVEHIMVDHRRLNRAAGPIKLDLLELLPGNDGLLLLESIFKSFAYVKEKWTSSLSGKTYISYPSWAELVKSTAIDVLLQTTKKWQGEVTINCILQITVVVLVVIFYKIFFSVFVI